MNFNPWHSVSYGENVPETVTAVIEIPKGSRAKYELDNDLSTVPGLIQKYGLVL